MYGLFNEIFDAADAKLKYISIRWTPCCLVDIVRRDKGPPGYINLHTTNNLKCTQTANCVWKTWLDKIVPQKRWEKLWSQEENNSVYKIKPKLFAIKLVLKYQKQNILTVLKTNRQLYVSNEV